MTIPRTRTRSRTRTITRIENEFEDENEYEDEYDDAAASESDASFYEDSVITSHQQDQIILGLNALSRVGGVLEKFDAFAAMMTQTIDRIRG